MGSRTLGATRMSSTERREEILEAALVEFARNGLDGARTDEVARRAGVSQPYVFRLFGTKKLLFLAAVARSFAIASAALADAAAGAEPHERLEAMRRAYGALARDGITLRAQLQALLQCHDEDVRRTVAAGFGEIVRLLAPVPGVDMSAIASFFAEAGFRALAESAGLELGWELLRALDSGSDAWPTSIAAAQ
jgi:AcrR family transcriptional regulator